MATLNMTELNAILGRSILHKPVERGLDEFRPLLRTASDEVFACFFVYARAVRLKDEAITKTLAALVSRYDDEDEERIWDVMMGLYTSSLPYADDPVMDFLEEYELQRRPNVRPLVESWIKAEWDPVKLATIEEEDDIKERIQLIRDKAEANIQLVIADYEKKHTEPAAKRLCTELRCTGCSSDK